jgi:hypothetical protein
MFIISGNNQRLCKGCCQYSCSGDKPFGGCFHFAHIIALSIESRGPAFPYGN